MLDQPGVFVKGIAPNSPASENGEFAQGDRILAINGTDLTGLTYTEWVASFCMTISNAWKMVAIFLTGEEAVTITRNYDKDWWG